MKRVAILGGTFNPVHIGHLMLAQSVLDHGAAEKVVFMPSNLPPHKSHDELASAADRLAMLHLAVDDNPAFEISLQEIERGGISYAYDTIADWMEKNPGPSPVFIIGMDTLRELHTWVRIGDLLPLCEFVALRRPGTDPEMGPTDIRLPSPWPERLLSRVIPGRNCEVSSTEIRERVASGREIRYLTPDAVIRYIAANDLYCIGAHH